MKDFINSNSSHPRIQAMKGQFKALEGLETENQGRAVGIGMSWETYWSKILDPNIWVDHTFIQAAAWFLKKDIRIVSITKDNDNPIRYLSGNINIAFYSLIILIFFQYYQWEHR